MKIAIIDDDKLFVKIMEMTGKLTGRLVEYIEFYDGETALEFFTKNVECPEELPDIIFLDLDMPVTDGWVFLNEFEPLSLKSPKRMPLYITTSSLAPTDNALGIKSPVVSGYLVKPVSRERLWEILDGLD